MKIDDVVKYHQYYRDDVIVDPLLEEENAAMLEVEAFKVFADFNKLKLLDSSVKVCNNKQQFF